MINRLMELFLLVFGLYQVGVGAYYLFVLDDRVSMLTSLILGFMCYVLVFVMNTYEMVKTLVVENTQRGVTVPGASLSDDAAPLIKVVTGVDGESYDLTGYRYSPYAGKPVMRGVRRHIRAKRRKR